MWSINCALLRIIVPNRVIPSGFLSIFVINKNIDMALQTTGLEFFYLSVDFSENDKILLVEQELGYIACIAFIGTYLPQGCLCCWREDRCLLFTRRLSEGCTADYVQQVVDALLERGFFSKAQYEKMEFLLRKVYRTITLRRYNNGSV